MQELLRVCQSLGLSSLPSDIGRPNETHCRPELTVLALGPERRRSKKHLVLERAGAVSPCCRLMRRRSEQRHLIVLSAR